MAAVPEEEFEQALEAAKEDGRVLARTAVKRVVSNGTNSFSKRNNSLNRLLVVRLLHNAVSTSSYPGGKVSKSF